MSQSDAAHPQGQSPWKLARKRFFRNIPAVAGLLWLIICLFIAIFAYVLMPDSTHNGNFQVVELPKRPPGTQADLLLRPTFVEAPEPGWLDFMLHGEPDRYAPIAIDAGALRLHRDTLFYTDLRGLETAVLLPEFMLNLDKYGEKARSWVQVTGKPYLMTAEGEITYVDRVQGVRKVTYAQLQADFQEQNLVTRTFHLGTDQFGRDVLSRLVLGTRISMAVGLMSVLVSLLLGITMGALAGFFRGWVDQVIMWFVSVVWSIPTLLLAISISFALGKGIWALFLAIGISTWVEVARIVRGQIFTIREQQYVEATTAMGFRTPRVIARHILPNILSPIIIVAAANFASAILIEAGLSFLGVGIQPPAPSWGSMIQEGYTQVMFDSGAWMAIFPGLAIILVVISLNLVGFGLRDALDPRYDK